MEKLNKTARAAPWLLCLALVIATPAARGTIIKNGGNVLPTPIDPGGTLLNTMSGTITTPSGLNTSYTTWVFSDPKNAFCAGCLDFVYQFTNNGPDVNERFTMSNFGGFNVDGGFDPDSTGKMPQSMNRNSNGQVIGFNYLGTDDLMTGENTVKLVIEVNTTHYGKGLVSAQDGTAAFASAFAPVPAVPEPSSLGLLGCGLLLAGGFLRKFR